MSDPFAFKQDFTDVYNSTTPVKYLEIIMRDLRLIERSEVGSKYAEKDLLPMFRKWAADLGKPLKFLDFMSSYGNDTLICTNGFQKEDFERCWGSDETCLNLGKPRQFPVTTWATDISANAISYGIEAGIFDEGSVLDLNNLTDKEKEMLNNRCRNANILSINSMGYLKGGVVEQIIGWFAEGTEPGMVIVGLIYPYNGVERLRMWKSLLLKKFTFFNSVPCFNRSLTELESQTFGKLNGTWSFSYYEYWFLTRST